MARAGYLLAHRRTHAFLPLRVEAGAFGESVPSRDLWLSPFHCVVAGESLIPISHLRNDSTIRQIALASVEYWHVELDRHDVIFAEGLPAESYLDTGNREGFVNGRVFREAHPEVAPKHWSDTCLPMAFDGPAIEAMKTRLHERALALGAAAADGEMRGMAEVRHSRDAIAVAA